MIISPLCYQNEIVLCTGFEGILYGIVLHVLNLLAITNLVFVSLS
jgi:hypothetical protein